MVDGLYHSYNGKVHPHLPKLEVLLSGLVARCALQPHAIVIQTGNCKSSDLTGKWESWDTFITRGRDNALGRINGEIEWSRQGFDWPLWILFSSGTTGVSDCSSPSTVSPFHLQVVPSQSPPFWLAAKKTHGFRPIVHRAGGMLLQAKKEFVICADLKEEDVFFYYTTT